MFYKINRFVNRIKNLIRWFPIIYRDQDWDDHFIFEILKFKLKNQAKYIGDKNRHLSAKRDAEIMMLCVRLIEKVQEEYYGCEYMDYHESDFRWLDTNNPDTKELDIVELSEHFDDYFKKYPLIYRMVPNLKAPKNVIAMQIARINEERAHKLLFKILEQNIQRWWD
jgi:hypothetical protein